MHQGSIDVAIFPGPHYPIADVVHPKTPAPLIGTSRGSSVVRYQPVEVNNVLPTINLGKLVTVAVLLPAAHAVYRSYMLCCAGTCRVAQGCAV